jgi:hypothetical protein
VIRVSELYLDAGLLVRAAPRMRVRLAVWRQGRPSLSRDVPPRPPPVLPRSNCVLTLRCILRCMTAESARLRSSTNWKEHPCIVLLRLSLAGKLPRVSAFI